MVLKSKEEAPCTTFEIKAKRLISVPYLINFTVIVDSEVVLGNTILVLLISHRSIKAA